MVDRDAIGESMGWRRRKKEQAYLIFCVSCFCVCAVFLSGNFVISFSFIHVYMIDGTGEGEKIFC